MYSLESTFRDMGYLTRLIFRNCDVCGSVFTPTQAGQGPCIPCGVLESFSESARVLIEKVVEDGNDAVQERIDYYNEQLDFIKDALDDDNMDLALEYYDEAKAPPNLRREEDPRFLDLDEYGL